MRLSILLMCLLFVPAFAADDEKAEPPNGWKEYVPHDKSFSVWLPDKGGRRSERDRTIRLRGQRLRVSMIQLKTNDGLTYEAATVVMPLQLTRRVTAQERIEIFRDSYVDEVKGRIENEKDVTMGRVKGKEYEIVTGQGEARLRLFAPGGRVYQAEVIGSKEQVTSADANTFLDSYKLPARATEGATSKGNPTGDNAPAEEPRGGRLAKVIPGDPFAFVQAAVKDKRVGEVNVRGFTLTQKKYRDTLADGGILIGFDVGFGKFLDNKTIQALRPIYRTKDGEKPGEWRGPASEQPTTVKAKPGYVVGGLSIRTGLGIDGFSVKFMKLEKDRIDTKDSYTSEWLGGQGGGPSTIGGQGYICVGICGNLNDQGVPCALGLLAVRE
jgi:hypothetical protein